MENILEYIGGRTYTDSISHAVFSSAIEKFLKEHPTLPLNFGQSKSWFSDIPEDLLTEIVSNLPGEKIVIENNLENNIFNVIVKHEENQLIVFAFYIQQNVVRQLTTSIFGSLNMPKVFIVYLEKCKFTQTLREENKVPIYYCFPSPQGRISLYTRNFESLPFDSIKDNYVPSVQNQTIELFARIAEATHGLVILHGPVGTGKTWLIKALLSEILKNRNGVICAPPSEFLATPFLLTQAVMEVERPVIILEDAGEMFQEDSKSRFQDQFSNLANYTDGLMSLMSEAIFLLTFNYDIKHLDAALTRNGRCIANIEVPRLPMEQASRLAGHQLEKGNYSLADLYAMKNSKITIAKPQPAKIGFSTEYSRKGSNEPVASSKRSF